MDLMQRVVDVLSEAMGGAFPEVTVATQERFGHYQCNSALKLAKGVGKAPREVAEEIAKRIEGGIFEKIEVAGPGFLNLTLSKNFISQGVLEMVRNPRLGIADLKEKKRVLVEFSSPNIAKEMHVGHLRSTIIGDCLARLFEFLGYDVLRVNHVGDWGTAFGMLIAYMQEEAKGVLSGQQDATLSELMQWYRASKKCFDESEAFKAQARRIVIELQGGKSDILHAWRIICEISRRAFQEIYALLDVKIEERGESFYNPMLPWIVQDLESKGLITVSEGAKCVFHEGLSIPLMVQKSDGGYNYDTTDMAAMKYRFEKERADRVIIITDSGQSLHFELIYKTALQAGYINPAQDRFDHVTFGVVLGADGKRFRTRSGDTERLIDLLTKAIVEAERILKERDPTLPPEELKMRAEVLGIGAVKYADLSSNRSSDYLFSYERMLRFEGNTAAFILYSYVRINGIKRKISGINIETLLTDGTLTLEHPSEVDLALQLLRFEETIAAITTTLLPHYLTEYLYTLAQKFNLFFRDCRVEGSPLMTSRLLLSEVTARVLAQGLHLLGLKTLDRM